MNKEKALKNQGLEFREDIELQGGQGLKVLLAQGLAPHLHACILRAKEI